MVHFILGAYLHIFKILLANVASQLSALNSQLPAPSQSFVNAGGADGIARCLGTYGAANQGGGSSTSGGGSHGPIVAADASPARPVTCALWSVITACT